MYTHETHVEDDALSQQALQIRERRMRRQMEDLVKCVIQDFGKTNGSNANEQLGYLFPREQLMYDWDSIPPSPVSDAIELLKYGGDVPTAREQLVRHAELFDAVTELPLFEAIQQKMVEGHTSTRLLVAQYFEDMEDYGKSCIKLPSHAKK